MADNLLGLQVTRAIPKEVLVGLLAGQYKMYGGVIRWAPGTEQAGQIVRHLIPVVSQTITDPLYGPINGMLNIANTYQLDRISVTTQTILQMATGTMVLSGLNLAVSAIGFAVINQKLKRLENQLNRIEKEVIAIHEMLEIEERARLGAALEDLVNAMRSQKVDYRRELLFHAKRDLALIRLKYKELLSKADSLEVSMGYEEYFVLTSLAHSRCLAELGISDTARHSLESDVTFWKGESKRIAHDLLLGDNPERLLFSDFAKNVPVTNLIEWLDFAHGEEKGYEQLDELRAMTTGWYTGIDKKEIGRKTGRALSNIGQKISRKADAELEWQLKKVIPSFQKLIARNSVLDGYVGQYQYLEEHNILPSTFENEIANISPEFHIDGYIILEPSLN
jgi:hypothetical protein